MYGGERAKIIGLDKSKNLIIQTENDIHKLSSSNIKVNNKHLLTH